MRAFALIVALLAPLAAPQLASACTIAARPPEERVRAADVAVFGKVVARERIEKGRAGDGREVWRYRFRVIETYKGRERRRLRLVGGTEESLCEAGLLRVGDRFGLVLDGARGPWRIAVANFITREELRQARRGRRG